MFHKLSKLVLVTSLGILATEVDAFVLLSGPAAAALDATSTAPDINFAISGEAPAIKDKNAFLGGKYASLDDQEFFKALVLEAMAAWNSVPTAFIELNIDESLDAKKDDTDRINSIVVDAVNASAAAYASPEIEKDLIVDCDIVVSSKSTEAKSLAYTLMHEIGHCLGLGHNHTNYDSVMGYSREDRKLRLGTDDKIGLSFLYPSDDLGNSTETLGCAVISHKQGHSPLKNLIVILLFMLPIFLMNAKIKLRRKKI